MKNLRTASLALSVVALALDATADATRSGLDNARTQLQQAVVPPGLEATLFALEPMVANPADMDIDARGRVWVTEGVNYRSSFQKWGVLRPEGDRIQILEDTNGDGVADKAKTFYQDLSINTALGICVLGNKVIVSASPYVFLLTDTNGDDVADTRELLFITDPKQADHDHAVHAFVFGPDGRMYFNFGNAGGFLRVPTPALKSLPLHGKIPTEELMKCPIAKDIEGIEISARGQPYRQGMAFRCAMDGSKIEVLGHNFRNNYEVAPDSFGTSWQPDNDDDGNKGVRVNYVMEGGNYGYTDEMTGAGWGQKRTGWEDEIPRRHWHLNDPGVVPNLILTGAGSPTGICVYEGDLLPAPFRGQPIHCDAGPRVVRAYTSTPDGAGYKAEINNLMTSEDNWFRPSDVCVAPDGSVYIADWNDAGVGGHYMADQKVETMTGRIYRVAPKGHRPSVPALDLNSAKGAVAALKSPNVSVRALAWQKLNALQGGAESELLKLWNDSNPRFRARALHLLARIQGAEAKYVGLALKDGNPDIRITGLRIAKERGLDLIPLVRSLSEDSNAQVRRECALMLRHHASPEMPKLWAKLASQYRGDDRWALEALGIGADKNWDACLSAYLEAKGGLWNTTSARDIIWRSRAKQTPDLLVKIINDKSTKESERARYLRSLDFLKGPEKDAALLQLLTADAK